MRYCRHRKIVFFFASRTGGTSLVYLLNSWGVPSINIPSFSGEYIRHLIPKEAETYIPDLKNYTRYCFFRNPTERFISACKFYRQTYDFDLTADAVVSNFDYYKEQPTFFKQINYFDNVQLLDFENYEDEIRKIGLLFGKENFKISKINVSGPKRLQISNAVLDFIKDYYAEDYKLGKEVFGKEY